MSYKLKVKYGNNYIVNDVEVGTEITKLLSCNNKLMSGDITVEVYSDWTSTYQQVEYLQSSGTQWIQTTTPSVSNSIYQCDIAYTSLRGDDYDWFIGERTSATVWLAGYYSSRACYWSASDSYKYAGSLSTNNRTILTVNLGAKTFTSSYAGTSTTFSYYNLNAPKLFIGNSDASGNNSINKVYSVTRTDGTTLVNNYIPVYRKSDNKPGLYDTINDKFYVNQKSGTDFTVGPDVN